jgi:uncharacterized protein
MARNDAGATRVTITVPEIGPVSGLALVPARAHALFVLAHGAGAGMTHPWLEAMAAQLVDRGIATLRFQFPFMERASRRPDPPAIAQATVRAAVEEAPRLAPGLPVLGGGRSFGGRMTSQAQAAAPLPGVMGLVFLGFPLHPAKRPGRERAAHLAQVHLPMLFLQGTRDELADLDLLRPVCAELADRATLHVIEGADHAFHVPARSGRTDEEVQSEMADVMAAWIVREGDPAARRNPP